MQTINGMGRLAPRLHVVFQASVQSDVTVEITDATLRLEHKQEVIGEGRVVSARLSDGISVTIEVPTTLPLLRHVTASLVPTATMVDLQATLRGFGTYTLRSERSETVVAMRYPPVGQPKVFPLETNSPGLLQVERTAWFDRVLKPTHGLDLEYLEVNLPPVESPAADGWRQALVNFHAAERSYATGDDASVFLHLRGAFDALPGAKQHIVDRVSNETKRKALDGLLAKVGAVLHSGRHVDAVGPDVGTFPVDHLDASFALDLMRVTLSHLSRILAAEARRGGDE